MSNSLAVADDLTRRTAAAPVGEPFGVYVHWPFCRAKCPYCDFNSAMSAMAASTKARFLAAYLTELGHFASLAPGRSVTSIFFGGGTPSLMRPSTVRRSSQPSPGTGGSRADAEITLEANPTSVEAENFAGYRAQASIDCHSAFRRSTIKA